MKGSREGVRQGERRKERKKISKDGILKIIGDVFLGLYGS